MADQIRGLSIEIGLGTAKLDSGLKDLRRTMQAVNSEMKANLSSFDRGEKSVDKYQTRIDGLNKKMEVQRAVVEKSEKAYKKMVEQHGEGSREADNAARKYNEEVASLNNLQRSIDGTTAELKEFERQQRIASSGWTKFGDKMKDIGGKMKAVGSGMQDVGKKMTLGITAPIVGLGAASVKASMDFESAFAGVRKTVNASEAEFAALEKGIREMAMEIPASAEEISGVAEAAGQLGIEKDAILGFTRTMIDLGESTNMTADEAATQLARLANIVQMPQENFDRLGSTIVALGNSMATTEGEITAMSLRLAAQGKQVGMTEDQILALAGAMSSVGIEAEAGGTAMTTVLKKMQTAVSDNGTELKGWAKVAGMSTKDFKKAFEDDAVTALDALIKGLAKSASEGGNMSEMLADLGIKGIREADTMMRLAGAGDTLTEALKTANAGWNENTALTDEAAQRYKTMESQLAILKNNLRDVAYDIGEILIPVVSNMLDGLRDGIKWFKGLSDETKKNMVVLAGVAAAIGPIIAGLGTLIVVGGNLVTIIGGISAAIGAAGGLGAALTGLAAATGPIGLTVLAIGGLTAGAVALGNYLSGPAIEEVDLFGKELEGVSESTKKALGEFWTLSDGVDDALIEMKVSAGIVTADIRDEVVGNFTKMHESILDGMQQNHEDRMKILLESFEGYRYLTDQEQQEIIKRNEQHHQTQIEKQEQAEARIREIMETAYKENRALTENEELEINAIKTQMQNDAIVQLSESAAEEAAIRQRLKDTKGEISKAEAADLIGRAAEVRDKTVQEAEKEYDEKVATYTYMRDELGTISADQAAKMIKAAKDERDNTVWEAEQKYGELYDTTVAGNADLELEIDRHTGEIRTKWEVFYRGLAIDLTKFITQGALKWRDFGISVGKYILDMKKDIAKKFSDIISDAKNLPKRMGAAFSAGAAVAGKGIADIGNSIIRTFEGAVNKVIDGVNAITSKLGFGSKLGHWNAGRIVAPRSNREGNARPVAAYAYGTDAHPGGPMVVGDLHGRELVEFPNGKMWLSPDTDTLVPNAPPGTRVIPNELTEKLIRGEVPFYAKGAGVLDWLKDKASNIWDYASNPGKLIDSLLSSVLGGIGLSGGSGDMVKSAVKYVGKQAVDYIKGMFQQAGDFTGTNFGSGFRLTSKAGWRIHPIFKIPRFHFGDDYAARAGTPVPSQSGGVVTQAAYHSARGNFVKVKSGIYDLIYQHLQKMLVGVGQSVTKGQILGTVGSTGHSTGPHLHFETWKNGKFVQPGKFALATGAMATGPSVNLWGEDGDEIMIPLHPKRRTDAMKLLAIAGKMLGADGSNVKRPNELPNITGGGGGDGTLQALLAATLEQNQILMQLLGKESGLYLEGQGRPLARAIAPYVKEYNDRDERRRDRFATT